MLEFRKELKILSEGSYDKIAPEVFVETPKNALAKREFSGRVELKDCGLCTILKYLTRSIQGGLKRIFPENWTLRMIF